MPEALRTLKKLDKAGTKTVEALMYQRVKSTIQDFKKDIKYSAELWHKAQSVRRMELLNLIIQDRNDLFHCS